MKANSEATPAAQVRDVDAKAREIWRYGEESFSRAWIRAWELLYNCTDQAILKVPPR